MTDEVAAAAALIPALAGWRGGAERLGGLTNRVYRLGDRVLRLPGAGTSAYIDRANEAAAARAAFACGVGPEVLHADPATGLMLTRFVPDAVTMTPDAFRTRPGAPARAGAAFARLHRSGLAFPARFEPFAKIEEYLALLAGRPVALPEGYHGVVAEARGAVRAALAARPAALVPCHCDPLCENFLDDGARMWIVDWEYSGMNDPLWDLGDLACEAGFGPEQEEEMLAAWAGRAPTEAERGRVTLYRALCDLLWTLWGLIQLADGNPAEDFRAYADTRFARCRALMAAPGFATRVAAVRAGG